MQQVHRGQALEEVEVGLPRLGVVGAADPCKEARQRVDRDRALRLHRRLRDQHRERRLAGADVAHQPQPIPLVEPLVDLLDELLHRLVDRQLRPVARHVGDRRAVEADAPVLARDRRGDSPRAPAGHTALATLAVRAPRPRGRGSSPSRRRPRAGRPAARRRPARQADGSGPRLTPPRPGRSAAAPRRPSAPPGARRRRPGPRSAGTARGRRRARRPWARCGAWR